MYGGRLGAGISLGGAKIGDIGMGSSLWSAEIDTASPSQHLNQLKSAGSRRKSLQWQLQITGDVRASEDGDCVRHAPVPMPDQHVEN